MREWDDAIGRIEDCLTLSDLKATLNDIIGNRGFSSFGFVEITVPGATDPLVISTSSETWNQEYRENDFYNVDPVLSVARRRNTPFNWLSVPLPGRFGRKKPGAVKTMEAARDHGFKNGLVVPFHYIDDLGISRSSVCTFFWKDKNQDFEKVVSEDKVYLHVVLLYWAQKAVEIAAKERNASSRFLDSEGKPLRRVNLTDREIDVLSWAGRGKTVPDTAEILGISGDTVETHMRNAMVKLGANNKTHAVVKAIFLRLIDI